MTPIFKNVDACLDDVGESIHCLTKASAFVPQCKTSGNHKT